MAGKHDAYVFNAGRTFKVRPALSAGTAGKPFSIRNLTDHTVDLDFPDGLMKREARTSIPAHRSRTFHIDRKADGFYRYQVDIVRQGSTTKARGESDPAMIVDP